MSILIIKGYYLIDGVIMVLELMKCLFLEKLKKWLDSYFRGEFPPYNDLKVDVGVGNLQNKLLK